MIYTIQDLERMKKYMVTTGIRDSQFPNTNSVEGATTVITKDNKEFKVLLNSENGGIFVPNPDDSSEVRPERPIEPDTTNNNAIVDIKTGADSNNPEDLVVVRVDGSSQTIDTGLSIDELNSLLN